MDIGCFSLKTFCLGYLGFKLKVKEAVITVDSIDLDYDFLEGKVSVGVDGNHPDAERGVGGQNAVGVHQEIGGTIQRHVWMYCIGSTGWKNIRNVVFLQ